MAKEKTEYVKCPKCGNEMPKGSAFCSACGSKIEEPKIEFVTCKHCGNQTPALSVFCMHCGSQLIKAKKTDEKKEIVVPTPRKLTSGKWFIYLRLDGKQYSITKDKYEDCIAEALAIKKGIIKGKASNSTSLKAACQNYIKRREGVRSESTLSGYECYVRTRFKDYMDKRIDSIDWQIMINEEIKKVCAKTIENAWGFVSSAVKEAGYEVPEVAVPQVIKKEMPWLDYEQILIFVEAIKGKKCEMGALLGLHGLRRSEIFHLMPKNIIYNEKKEQFEIHVEGATVRGRDNKKVDKNENKTVNSRRIVPVMIPRLETLIKESTCAPDEPYVNTNLNRLYDKINRVCVSNNLPKVGTHGLRRSFASLCYHLGIPELETMQLGGWDDFKTMHNFYVKLAGKDKDKTSETIKEFYKQGK